MSMRGSVLEAARRVDAASDHNNGASGIRVPLDHRSFPCANPDADDLEASMQRAALAALRKREAALAGAISEVMRASLRAGQPVGVVRHLDAEAVTEIHAILCRVQDAPVQAVVSAEAGE